MSLDFSSDTPHTVYDTQAYINTDEWIKIIVLQIVEFIQFTIDAACAELLHI